MDSNLHIPFIPRSIKEVAAPVLDFCERTLDLLAPIIANALDPFPEARRALALAFISLKAPEPVT
jgi:hypothetical protein